MHQNVQLSVANPSLAADAAVACPVQVLVIDDPNGPASILVNTISMLVDQDISVTTVDDHTDALRALTFYHFDLVVVGLYASRSLQLAILPHIHEMDTRRPILAVGRELPRQYQQVARTYGASDVLDMPQRAAELKHLVRRMSERYLDEFGAACA